MLLFSRHQLYSRSAYFLFPKSFATTSTTSKGIFVPTKAWPALTQAGHGLPCKKCTALEKNHVWWVKKTACKIMNWITTSSANRFTFFIISSVFNMDILESKSWWIRNLWALLFLTSVGLLKPRNRKIVNSVRNSLLVGGWQLMLCCAMYMLCYASHTRCSSICATTCQQLLIIFSFQHYQFHSFYTWHACMCRLLLSPSQHRTSQRNNRAVHTPSFAQSSLL